MVFVFFLVPGIIGNTKEVKSVCNFCLIFFCFLSNNSFFVAKKTRFIIFLFICWNLMVVRVLCMCNINACASSILHMTLHEYHFSFKAQEIFFIKRAIKSFFAEWLHPPTSAQWMKIIWKVVWNDFTIMVYMLFFLLGKIKADKRTVYSKTTI